MNTPQYNCRLRLPERNQVEIRCLALDQLLPDDHQARIVWAYVEGLDLTPLYQAIQACQGVAGRDANDPRILMAGRFAAQGRKPATIGTLPCDTPTFAALTLGAVLLLGALCFLPALALGPVAEQLQPKTPISVQEILE